jgi:hypothetical protein
MIYPNVTYQTLAALLQDTNTIWIPNGVGDITGIFGNAQINGLAKFIQQSPLNWNGAKTITTGGDITLSNGVTVISGITPTSITFGDNVYNEWIIINLTGDDVNLASGKVYYTSFGEQLNYIPANQALRISKGINSLWYQSNNFTSTSGSGNTVFNEIDAIVGVDSPIIIPANATTYTINSANIATKSVKVYIDGTRIFPNIVGQLSVDIVYTPNFVTITFFNYSLDTPTENLGLQYGMKVIIDYAISSSGSSVDTFDNTFDNTFS